MKKYTVKLLVNNSYLAEREPEDMCLGLPDKVYIYLWAAFRDSVAEAPTRNILSLLLLAIALVYGLISGSMQPFNILLCLLFVAKGGLMFNYYRLYRKMYDNNFFLRFDMDGISHVMYNGERYTRVNTVVWGSVTVVSVYKKFFVITDGNWEYFVWANDMRKAYENVLCFWMYHLQKKEKPLPEVYSMPEFQKIEDFIDMEFGPINSVLHEKVSPDIHVDIVIIRPTDERNYCTLCTIGMGAHRMNIPQELHLQGFAESAELLIYLPADWRVGSLGKKKNECEDWEGECNYWPIRLLKDLARMPIKQNTWLGWGSSSSDEILEPFSESTDLCASMLVAPLPDIMDWHGKECNLDSGRTVAFYQVIPLFYDELKNKQLYDAEEVLEQIGTDDWIEMLTERLHRPSGRKL